MRNQLFAVSLTYSDRQPVAIAVAESVTIAVPEPHIDARRRRVTKPDADANPNIYTAGPHRYADSHAHSDYHRR